METDVLNPTPYWDASLNDSIAPDFGFETMRPTQLARAKVAGGQPESREIGNGGHTTKFSWVNRSLACVEKLKRFAEEFEQEYFTVIDHDKKRHYVGNFVGEMPIVQAGNDRFNAQGWQFEEMPGVPMLEYPAQWDRWAVSLFPYDGRGRQKIATSGANWGGFPPLVTEDGTAQPSRQIGNNGATAGDWATYEYRGYGCRLWARMGPSEGIVTVSLDGAPAVQVDLYDPNELGVVIALELLEVSLDLHRLTVTMTGTKNDGSSGPGMTWDRLEVMR